MIYVLNVVTGKEDVVIRYIELLGHEKIKEVYKPVSIFQRPNFPGYLFVDIADFDLDVYYALKDIPNVMYFLDPHQGIIPLKENEEEPIRHISNVSLIDRPVKIISGIYEGIVGRIKEIKYPYMTIQTENLFNLAENPLLKVHIKYLMLVDTTLEPGDKVVINDGEYAGITGTVEQILYPTAVVAADIFDQEVLLEVPIYQLERRVEDAHGDY